jgi:hypothetical protein
MMSKITPVSVYGVLLVFGNGRAEAIPAAPPRRLERAHPGLAQALRKRLRILLGGHPTQDSH